MSAEDKKVGRCAVAVFNKLLPISDASLGAAWRRGGAEGAVIQRRQEGGWKRGRARWETDGVPAPVHSGETPEVGIKH